MLEIAGVVYEEEVAPLPPETLDQVVLSDDCSHWILPVEPLNERIVVVPEHKLEEEADAVPPEGLGVTLTNVEVEFAEHPFVTTHL